MNLYESLSSDQQEMYYRIVVADQPDDQFTIWLSLAPMDAKLIFAALPTGMQDFLCILLYNSLPHSEPLASYYKDQPAKLSQMWDNIERYRKAEVTYGSKRHAVNFKALTKSA